jgi:hypothetical protein
MLEDIKKLAIQLGGNLELHGNGSVDIEIAISDMKSIIEEM